MKPWGIEEEKLSFFSMMDTQKIMPRGLGFIGNNGQLFPENDVEEGGFSYIGCTQDGDVAGLKRHELPVCFLLQGLQGLAGRVLFRVLLALARAHPIDFALDEEVHLEGLVMIGTRLLHQTVFGDSLKKVLGGLLEFGLVILVKP